MLLQITIPLLGFFFLGILPQGPQFIAHPYPFTSSSDCFLFPVHVSSSCTGLFEQRVEQYLEELPDTEQSGMNKFLRGLGK